MVRTSRRTAHVWECHPGHMPGRQPLLPKWSSATLSIFLHLSGPPHPPLWPQGRVTGVHRIGLDNRQDSCPGPPCERIPGALSPAGGHGGGRRSGSTHISDALHPQFPVGEGEGTVEPNSPEHRRKELCVPTVCMPSASCDGVALLRTQSGAEKENLRHPGTSSC